MGAAAMLHSLAAAFAGADASRDLAWERIHALEMLSREVKLLDTFVVFGLCPSPVFPSLELHDSKSLKLMALNRKNTEGREQATRCTAPLSAIRSKMTWWLSHGQSPLLTEGAGAKKLPSVLKARVGKKAGSSSSS